MALTFPVPNDATYDYVPISGPYVKVGTDLVSSWTVQATVTHAFPPGGSSWWVYFMDTFNPDGTTTIGTALFPSTPGTQAANWWQRIAIWRRTPKLDDKGTVTASDSSKWIYAAGEDGRMICYMPGTTFARGDRRFRGELTTDPQDLWICDDKDWDWLPVTSGDQVVVGDTITFLFTQEAVVDEIDVVDDGAYRRHLFKANTSLLMDPFGWWDEIIQPDPTWTSLNTFNFLQRLPKPAAESKFRAPDGSRWVYIGTSLYYCWGRGTSYAPGAMNYRGQIAGGLTPIA